MPVAPDAFHVGGSNIARCTESWESIKDDPRGLLLMWHEPKPNAQYIVACDPTMGITSWSRATKKDGDEKIDNCAIEIFQSEAIPMPLFNEDGTPKIDPATKQQAFIRRDMQVAEYAGPVDAVEAARICKLLGRIYQGSDEEYARLIYEAWPGPGVLTTQELLRLNYTNIWMWEYITGEAEETNRMGWQASLQSMKILWMRSRRHLMERKAKIYSQWLVEEYANAVVDLEKMRAKAAYGYHDDRFCAANMAFWAAHRWSYDESPPEPVTSTGNMDYQTFAPTLGEDIDYRSAWEASVDNWFD